MQTLRLDDDLLSYLLDEPMFSCDAHQLEGHGFSSCCDHPAIPGHSYWEGYFHGQPQGWSVPSLNPRTGESIDKPAAPLRLRAFLAAVRSVNATWCARLARADGIPAAAAELLGRGHAFGDLAVQVHCGDEVAGDAIAWHQDAINSCLHLALSLRGERRLHSLLGDGDGPSELTHRSHAFAAGDVYVSSPWAFLHGVEYPEASWEGRIVAVQCRLLFSLEEQRALHAEPEAFAALLAAVTAAVASGAFRLPSLREVEAEAARLDRLTAADLGRRALDWIVAALGSVATALRPTDATAIVELAAGVRGEEQEPPASKPALEGGRPPPLMLPGA